MGDRQLSKEEIDAVVAKDRAIARAADAEAAKFAAEATKIEIESAYGKLNVAARTIEVEEATRVNSAKLAGNEYNHIYVFDKQVDEGTVKKCIEKLTEWSRLHDQAEIEIIFNSPGGSVVDGMALYDFLTQLKGKGHKLTTSSIGMAASMAGILLQAGDTRKMGPEAWLLIHEASFGAIGSFGDVEDKVEWIRKIQDRILDIFAKRSTMPRAQIKKNWSRKDWWLSSDEALKHGFIDEIG